MAEIRIQHLHKAFADFTAVKGWYQRLKSRPSFRPLLGDSIRGIAPPAAYADLDF